MLPQREGHHMRHQIGALCILFPLHGPIVLRSPEPARGPASDPLRIQAQIEARIHAQETAQLWAEPAVKPNHLERVGFNRATYVLERLSPLMSLATTAFYTDVL